MSHHQEEGRSQIIEDEKHREKIRNFFLTCIHPFDTENHPVKTVNMNIGKLSNNVNCEKCIEIGIEQFKKIHQTQPEGFYAPLIKQDKTFSRMSILQKRVRINNDEIMDTSVIYSRVIAMSLTNPAMTLENVFKDELAPITTSTFNDHVDLRPAKSKEDLKNFLESKASIRTMNKPELTIIDGSAILWVESWPTKPLVIDYLQNFSSYILQKLATCNIKLVFDRYYDYSIKSSTRSGCEKSKITTLASSEK